MIAALAQTKPAPHLTLRTRAPPNYLAAVAPYSGPPLTLSGNSRLRRSCPLLLLRSLSPLHQLIPFAVPAEGLLPFRVLASEPKRRSSHPKDRNEARSAKCRTREAG